jgi:hypothetical protein
MGSMENLDRAIATHEQAIESTSGRHPDHAMYLTKLGNAVQNQFKLTGVMEYIREAVESTPDDRPDHVMYLTNLGNALQIRF